MEPFPLAECSTILENGGVCKYLVKGVVNTGKDLCESMYVLFSQRLLK